MYLWIVGAILVLGGLAYSYVDSHPNGVIDNQHEGDVRTTVAQFGNQLNTVSVLSPTAAEDIRKAYESYVTPELLSVWEVNPLTAPGRTTSSPWPDHIEVDTVTMNATGGYDVLGRIMLVTSTGDAGFIPVTLTVSDVGGSFLISRYEENPQAAIPEEPAYNSATVTIRLNDTVSVLGLTLTPEVLEEDSRCPSDVQCIQAGTVRARVSIGSGMGESSMVLTLGTPITTEAETITLISVEPGKISTTQNEESEYRFTFEVSKRSL